MKSLKLLSPITILFVVLTVLFWALRGYETGADAVLLLGGNLLIFVLSVLSFLLLHRSLHSANPQAFIQSFYISVLVKFVLVATVTLIYARSAKTVDRTSVMICMALYLVYTFIELRIILKESKKQNARKN